MALADRNAICYAVGNFRETGIANGCLARFMQATLFGTGFVTNTEC